MRSIGVRELRQRASTYLRQVEAGQTVEITARGRPVALLVPLRGAGHVERLVRRGRVHLPTGDLLALGTPLAPEPGVAPPSALLERARAVERQIEVLRAVRRHGAAALTRGRRLLQRLHVVHLDDELLDAAAALDLGVLRSLDAIHLAAAQVFGDELTAVVTYDHRMTAAAALLDLPVEAPR